MSLGQIASKADPFRASLEPADAARARPVLADLPAKLDPGPAQFSPQSEAESMGSRLAEEASKAAHGFRGAATGATAQDFRRMEGHRAQILANLVSGNLPPVPGLDNQVTVAQLPYFQTVAKGLDGRSVSVLKFDPVFMGWGMPPGLDVSLTRMEEGKVAINTPVDMPKKQIPLALFPDQPSGFIGVFGPATGGPPTLSVYRLSYDPKTKKYATSTLAEFPDPNLASGRSRPAITMDRDKGQLWILDPEEKSLHRLQKRSDGTWSQQKSLGLSQRGAKASGPGPFGYPGDSGSHRERVGQALSFSTSKDGKSGYLVSSSLDAIAKIDLRTGEYQESKTETGPATLLRSKGGRVLGLGATGIVELDLAGGASRIRTKIDQGLPRVVGTELPGGVVVSGNVALDAKQGTILTKELFRSLSPKDGQAVPADQAKGTGAYAFHPSYKEATAMHPLDLGHDRVGVFAEVPGGWALRVLSLTEPGHQS